MKYFHIFSALLLSLALTACGGAKTDTETGAEPAAEPTEIMIFAAASLEESLTAAIEEYLSQTPGLSVNVTYDSSGTLKTQIEEGAPCDLFLSAAPRQMDALDGSLTGTEKNPGGLDFVVQGTRVDLLENKVVLAVPVGNPAGIESFDQLAGLLRNGEVLLAVGNSDVPVGQYTQKIFDYYGIDESAVSHKLTYGSNVKEVTTQVSEAAVDCGIVYATDAASIGLTMVSGATLSTAVEHTAPITVVDAATAEMCGQVIYPAAVLNCGEEPEAAQAFLDFLRTDTGLAHFEAVGFSPLG